MIIIHNFPLPGAQQVLVNPAGLGRKGRRPSGGTDRVSTLFYTMSNVLIAQSTRYSLRKKKQMNS